MRFLFVALLCITGCISYPVDNLTEKIDLGNGTTIRGAIGVEYQQFLGIPYAKPPVGELRFANPQPNQWTGNLDAINHPNMCIQVNYLIPNAQVEGAEDCLYLNVYRPNIDYDNNTILDVMVYIHGGGFFAGSIHPVFVGPQYFMKEKAVIIVAMQYRLSVIGFLSTGDKESPGNFGLKDQTLALKWVKENIAKFGGNANSITIFGQSAGAASTLMHLVSPLSRGLFHKVIAMSGSSIGPYNYPTKDPLELARRQANAVNIENADTLSTRELVDKLRQVNASELIASVSSLKFFSIDPMTLYRLVLEPKTVDDAFLVEDPWTLMKRGQMAKVQSILTGIVDNEGAVRGAPIVSNATLLEEFNDRLDELLPKMLELTIEEPKLEEFMKLVKDQYLLGEDKISESNKMAFIKMYTDRSFYYPFYKALPYLARHIPTYLYKFSYRGELSYSTFYTGTYMQTT